jgi:4-amino-4-deoxy-L-arabinose transferase-like glycosyltransferase
LIDKLRDHFPRRLLLFVAAVTLVRLVTAALTPLTEDEAYYRLWAASLQFGYYDHPPMIAWWIRLGEIIAGDNPLGLRLIPVLSSGLTSLLIFDLAGRVGAAKPTAERAAIWYNATLLIGAGGALATPDAAAVPFWTLTLWCLVRAEDDPQSNAFGRWWLAAGVAAGLACLSKYSALFLAPGVGLWLLLKPRGLEVLKKPWPWLAALIAVAIFSLNVWWNAEHHWLTFAKQFGRVAATRWAPGYVVEFLIGQLLLLNPLITVFAVAGVIRVWRPREAPSPGLRLLTAAALPFAAYLLVHALHDRVQAHWPAPLYPTLVICAAIAAERALSKPSLFARRAAAPFGLGLSALVLLHAAFAATDIKKVDDPTSSLRDWPAFASRIEALRLAVGAGWVGTFSYGTTGELADQPALKAPVLELMERARYPEADPSWSVDITHRPGLMVDLDRRLTPSLLGRCFAVVVPLGQLTRGEGVNKNERYAAFAVSQPKSNLLKDGCDR